MSENTTKPRPTRATTRREKKRLSATTRGVLFVVVLLLLSGLAYLGYSLVRGNNPVSALLNGNLSTKTATIGVSAAPQTLDIRTTEGNAIEQALIGNVYEGLTSRDNENKAAKGLASSWDVSDDQLTYTFHLNSNMSFSNGHELTSEDVVWSLRELMTKKYPGYKDLTHLSAVSSAGNDTVVIKLAAPNPNLLWELGGRAGLVFDQEASYDAQSTAVGSGPFTVADFSKGKSITLERNLNYWGTKAALAKVTLQASDSATALYGVKKGNLQAAIGLNTAQMNSAKADSSVQLTTGFTSTKMVMFFNSGDNSMLSDKRFRQAIRMGLDNAKVIAALGEPAAPLAGPIPQLDPGYEDLTAQFPTDTAQSANLRRYFRVYSLKLIYTDEVPESIIQSIKAQYAAQYMNIVPTKLSAEQWNQAVEKQDFDMAVTPQSKSHDAAQWFSGDGWWIFDSPPADETYRDAIKTPDEGQRNKKLAQAAKTLSEGAPANWLYTQQVGAAWSPELANMPTNMIDTHLPLAGLTSK